MKQKTDDGSNGNVLFMILIAVALFAALSLAVGSSSRVGKSNIDTEKIKLRTSQILDYAATLRVAMQRLVVSGKDPTIIVLHEAGADYKRCKTGTNCFFTTTKVGEVILKPDATDEYGNVWSYFESADGQDVELIGTSAPDLQLQRYFTYDAAGLALCKSINLALGITGVPVRSSTVGLPYINGAPGQVGACLNDPVSPHYIFYYVLQGV